MSTRYFFLFVFCILSQAAAMDSNAIFTNPLLRESLDLFNQSQPELTSLLDALNDASVTNIQKINILNRILRNLNHMNPYQHITVEETIWLKTKILPAYLSLQARMDQATEELEALKRLFAETIKLLDKPQTWRFYDFRGVAARITNHNDLAQPPVLSELPFVKAYFAQAVITEKQIDSKFYRDGIKLYIREICASLPEASDREEFRSYLDFLNNLDIATNVTKKQRTAR